MPAFRCSIHHVQGSMFCNASVAFFLRFSAAPRDKLLVRISSFSRFQMIPLHCLFDAPTPTSMTATPATSLKRSVKSPDYFCTCYENPSHHSATTDTHFSRSLNVYTRSFFLCDFAVTSLVLTPAPFPHRISSFKVDGAADQRYFSEPGEVSRVS